LETDNRKSSKSSKLQKNHDSDDENFEETPEQRAFPNFLQNLPGVTASDSMGYRIEALRVYLEQQLGDQPFVNAYKHLIVSLLSSNEHSYRICKETMMTQMMSLREYLVHTV
jgi:hypothetical protein